MAAAICGQLPQVAVYEAPKLIASSRQPHSNSLVATKLYLCGDVLYFFMCLLLHYRLITKLWCEYDLLGWIFKTYFYSVFVNCYVLDVLSMVPLKCVGPIFLRCRYKLLWRPSHDTLDVGLTNNIKLGLIAKRPCSFYIFWHLPPRSINWISNSANWYFPYLFQVLHYWNSAVPKKVNPKPHPPLTIIKKSSSFA